MEWTYDQEALIDRFLNDTMTGEDLKEWEVLMKISTFRWHVEARKKDFDHSENEAKKKEKLSFERTQRPSGQTRIWVLIIILILMMLVVFLM